MKRSNRRIKRKAKKSYLIILDGETEIWYLQLMKQNENLKEVRIKPELPKNKRQDIYAKLKQYQKKAIKNAEKLGSLDFGNIESAKAEIYKIFNILMQDK